MNTEVIIFSFAFVGLFVRFGFQHHYAYTSILSALSIIAIAYFDLNSAIFVFVISALSFIVLNKGSKTVQKAFGIVISILILFHSLPKLHSVYAMVGISYYGLQLVSLLLYPPKKKPTFTEVLLGTTFLPKFFAGPILNQNKIQSVQSNFSEDFSYGLQRILLGIFKKFVLATRLDFITSGFFEAPMQANNISLICISSLLYTLQLYLEFSAYMDIAIGVGRWLGFQLPENFKLPMRSRSVSDYWRKTHITLIQFFTQYIYYPITYYWRKHKLWPAAIGVILTFVLSGIWHEFKSGYILWGVINAGLIIFEMITRTNKRFEKIALFNILWVIPSVSVANIFFRLPDYSFSEIFNLVFNLPFLPEDSMADFIAILGKGGYLAQQFHLAETIFLTLIFFLFEPKLEKLSRSTEIKTIFCILLSLSILLFGKFADSSAFIYLQF
jgi:alginate O-acetyltransferase complex protein AlgI